MYIDIERIFAHIPFLMLFTVTLPHWIDLACRPHKLNSLSGKGMTIAFIRTTGFMIIRWVQTKHLPSSNLYESSMFLSWSFSLSYIILKVRNQNDWSGAVTAPGAMPTHAFATSGLPGGMQQSTQLVPALQSHRLMMHVSMMLLSHATLLRGSLSAISLSIIYSDKTNRSSISNLNHKLCVRLLNTNSYYHDQKQTDVENPFYLLSLNSKKCQLINQLDQWAYQIISLGFSFLTIGILSGAVWANEAWGSYWSWDPKETWALVTWLIHAIYLHTKITKSWGGEGPAAVASTGFFLVWIRFSGVNPSGIGLHNYGWLI
uniref:Cytochrome c biogenesis protein CcsA n=1 Tax=Cibotium barometz TaxID=29588 RepID=A0A2S1PVB7_CIBBA|nr:heme attachment to plastid cytochrome c [Cibotium barometz]YP_010878772.1 cytochrome c biogenesis protein [Cibotium cumingii]AWH62751.1 heme attachment to plastid cytochrome c [Cibotium barometz]WHE37965.1 cytochrome c biogenesis protein [Cibotium barometz]WHE38052.1 cytochrome c biogenesis protein [Cibotium barometz]WHE38140.1 cytochrome c biogenesis protein [Cibotium barometz]WHE38662.1 cytochrome c biogenesis protein [Cibotium cumingii]